jgi:hypothetical protein
MLSGEARLTVLAIIDDASDSDTPLALLLSRSRGTRQLTFSTEKLQSGEKGKARAREDGFDYADMNIFREGHPLGEPHAMSHS